MSRRSSLRKRVLLGLLAYVAFATAAVLAYGFIIQEQAERTLWHALLEAEFEHLLANTRRDAGYRWMDTETLALYSSRDGRSMPLALADLEPGLYDEIVVDGQESVVLVRDEDGTRWALALDITDLERREAWLAATVLTAMLVMVVVLGLGIWWGVDRLLRPLREVAHGIGRLRPDHGAGRIEVDGSASTEVAVIADALNDYLHRNALFVERERAFIDSASHELRTPISVIAGAAELASAQPGMPPTAQHQLARIRRTSHEIERLIALLLVLAKDPQRLAYASDRIDLDQLLPEIVEDYRPMALEKGLTLALMPPPACEIVAPMPVVQAAIGNLLRNAIENSDSGEIAIRLQSGAVVEIVDPGHGMTPEEISTIYARMARGGGREGTGIGLQLISRLCAHLGWRLDIASAPAQGTTARLELRPRET
jgi:signal transduction histidine kinase